MVHEQLFDSLPPTSFNTTCKGSSLKIPSRTVDPLSFHDVDGEGTVETGRDTFTSIEESSLFEDMSPIRLCKLHA